MPVAPLDSQVAIGRQLVRLNDAITSHRRAADCVEELREVELARTFRDQPAGVVGTALRLIVRFGPEAQEQVFRRSATTVYRLDQQ